MGHPSLLDYMIVMAIPIWYSPDSLPCLLRPFFAVMVVYFKKILFPFSCMLIFLFFMLVQDNMIFQGAVGFTIGTFNFVLIDLCHWTTDRHACPKFNTFSIKRTYMLYFSNNRGNRLAP